MDGQIHMIAPLVGNEEIVFNLSQEPWKITFKICLFNYSLLKAAIEAQRSDV